MAPTIWLARLSVSAVFFAVLFVVVPFEPLWAALRTVAPAAAAMAVALFLAGHLIAAAKWRLLMGDRTDVPPALWLRAHFSGLIANLCLPGIAGGDVVRAAWVMRKVDRPEGIGVASVADRAIDCLALLTLAGAGAVSVGRFGDPTGDILAVAVAVAALGMIIAGAAYAILIRRVPHGLLGRVLASARQLMARPLIPIIALVLSIGVQGSFVVINAWLGAAAGVQASAGAWLLAWPLAKLIALLPISLAGLGVREAALVAFMKPFGASSSGILAVGLLWEAVLVAGGVVGWAVTLTLGGREAVRPQGAATL